MQHYLKATGFLAVGVLGLQAAHGQSKPWTVSASVRGFYDDNYATAPSSPAAGQAGPQDSFGFELSPSAGISWKRDQTDVKADYTYTLRYYENRPNSADHTHQFDGRVDQKFGADRYRALVTDSFVVAQEATLLDPALAATPLRSQGDNVRNLARLTFQMEITEPLAVEAGYSNGFYDYEETGPASRSALLDRMEHLALVNLRWKVQRTTIGIFGYQFGVTDQTSKDTLDVAGTLSPDIRDSRSHYGYVGADHWFTEKLSTQARVGLQYTEYPNAPAGAEDDTLGPYADLSGVWNYAENSLLQLGVRHTRTQTDVTLAAAGTPTLDTETTALYLNWKHQITAKISSAALLQFQTAEFNQGAAANQRDNYFLAGLNVGYAINDYLSAEAGYNYDRLNSDLASRSFTRNRVYLGIRAKY